MRRASSLLSTITKPKTLPRSLITSLFFHPIPQNPLPKSPIPHTLPSPFSPHLRFTHTMASPSPPSIQTLQQALESATTTESLLSSFESLETSLDSDDSRLGMACLKVGEHLDSTGSQDLEKALNFAVRALKILESGDLGLVPLAKALRLVGSISCKLKRFDESLDSLDTAVEILKPEKESLDATKVRIAVQMQLADTKTVMGRRWDALSNLRRSFEFKRLILKADSVELGIAYKELAEAYAVVLDFGAALQLCLKALEIVEGQPGDSSAEEVKVRQLLGVIYMGLGESEKALDENEISCDILKNLDMQAELLNAEIEAANIKIALGRLGEAIDILKGVIQRVDKKSETRALVFVSMAKALFHQEKFVDSRRCLEISCGLFDKMELVSLEKVAEAYAEISMLYEMMSEFEIAISLMGRTLTILEKLPREQHLEGSISARMGWLLLLTRRVAEATPYLESAVEKLKGSFGPTHFGLGFAYKHLGQAYLEMDKPQLAVQMLVLAKEIINGTFGPDHEDSIDTSQWLANAYGSMGSYARAMEFQQRVIDGWQIHESEAGDALREAHRLLEQLKRKAQGSPSAVFPANSLPLSQKK